MRVRKRLALIASASVVAASTATFGQSAAAAEDMSFLQGFTVVTFGDARIGNHELEGTLAVGGDVSFASGYPMVHSTGLTPTDYALPVVNGDPTRLLVGGQFDVAASSGVSEMSSRNNETSDQLGYLKLGDISNVAIGPRGNGGVWVGALGTDPGAEPAIYVSDRVGQPLASVAALGAFDALFGTAQSQAVAFANSLSACGGVATSLQPGSHAGERTVELQAGKTNVLTVEASELGDFFIAFTGAQLGPDTTLVVNVTGDVTNVRLPKFSSVTSPSAANPNQVAPHVLWNFGNATGVVGVSGDLVSGSIVAPLADLQLAASSPFEGQIVAGGLTTGGSEIHHYAFAGELDCTEEEPTEEEPTEEEPTEEEPTEEEPTEEEPTEEESTVDESTGEESTDDESTDGESTGEESTDEESTDEESTDEESTDEESTDEESTDEESTNGTTDQGSHQASTGKDAPVTPGTSGYLPNTGTPALTLALLVTGGCLLLGGGFLLRRARA